MQTKHSYEQLIKNAIKRGFKCPICANRQLLSGYNDFETRYPELAKEWNYEKNILKPNQVFPGSLKKVWWKHDITINNKKYIHEWESCIASRTSGNKGCPYCGGRKVLKGFNDFQSHYPELAKEWDYQLNNCKPDEITYGSNKKIHWICSKNHKYEAYVPDRRQGDGCPICSLKLRTSKPEKAIYFYLKKLFPDSICNYKQNWLGRKELDIYIPSLKLAIEYDGQKWHKDKEKDILKNKICEENNVTLIRIREPKCPDLNYGIYYTLDSTYIKNLDKAIYYIINYINKKYNLKLFLKINILNDIEQITKLIE